MAFIGSRAKGTNGIYLADEAAGTIEPVLEIAAERGALVNMHWLPNGQYITFCTATDWRSQTNKASPGFGKFAIGVVNTVTLKKRFLARGLDPVPSNSGELIAYLAREPNERCFALMVANVTTGQTMKLSTELFPVPESAVAWSPDDRYVACYAVVGHPGLREDMSLVVVDVDKSEYYTVHSYAFGFINRSLLEWSSDGTCLYYRLRGRLMRFNTASRKQKVVLDFQELPGVGGRDIPAVFPSEHALVYFSRGGHFLDYYDYYSHASIRLLKVRKGDFYTSYFDKLLSKHPTSATFAVLSSSEGIWVVHVNNGQQRKLADIKASQKRRGP